jgi:SAM-dependent methyltransferase
MVVDVVVRRRLQLPRRLAAADMRAAMLAQSILQRRVQPELLDALPPDNAQARRSRADLRRLNRIMGTLPIVLKALDDVARRSPPRRILELGAGDGQLMLEIARHRATHWPNVAVTLLDRQNTIDAESLQGIRALGWRAGVIQAEAVDWMAHAHGGFWDVVVANLFIHHFALAEILRLFKQIAARTDAFLCCEPRRSRFALASSHLVGLLLVGRVTRADAVLSVQAGFRDNELSSCWPVEEHWTLREYSAGLYSHCLLALRSSP